MLLSSSRPSFFFYIFFCFFSLCILKGFPCACILGWIFEEISLKGFETGFLILSSKKKEIKLAEKVAKHARTHYPQMLTINLTYVQLYSTIFSTKTKKPKMSKRRIQTMSSKWLCIIWCKAYNNAFAMTVFHFRQKHMYHVDLENEYEMTFFGTVLKCVNIIQYCRNIYQ